MTTPDQRTEQTVLYFLRHPRGRYFAERAAQLSGIPLSTLYDWRRREVYVPDFSSASPAMWSYRDLVFVRLLVWLRQIGMPRPLASEMVGSVRAFAASGEQIRRIRADRYTLLINEETSSRFKNQSNLLPFDNIYELFRTFDILEPIDEFRTHGQRRMWAPHLVTPSQCTRISPFVLAGDPCINRTRIPTSAIFGLREERGLSSSEIVRLYPGLAIEAADDAYLLERRLRGSDLPDIVSV